MTPSHILLYSFNKHLKNNARSFFFCVSSNILRTNSPFTVLNSLFQKKMSQHHFHSSPICFLELTMQLTRPLSNPNNQK